MSKKIYIREMAEILDRMPGTVRKWDQDGLLPLELKPQRGEANRRYWTEDQVEPMVLWASERIPGFGLVRYNPDPDRVSQHRHAMRHPKSTSPRKRQELLNESIPKSGLQAITQERGNIG